MTANLAIPHPGSEPPQAEHEYPSERLDKYVLRLPDGLRDEIKLAARAARRSMNAEIIHRLSTDETPMAREDDHMRIRLPADLHAKLRDAAATGGRSMTAEVVRAIAAWLPHADDAGEISGVEPASDRDAFARQVLIALIGSPNRFFKNGAPLTSPAGLAELAYEYADAMRARSAT